MWQHAAVNCRSFRRTENRGTTEGYLWRRARRIPDLKKKQKFLSRCLWHRWMPHPAKLHPLILTRPCIRTAAQINMHAAWQDFLPLRQAAEYFPLPAYREETGMDPQNAGMANSSPNWRRKWLLNCLRVFRRGKRIQSKSVPGEDGETFSRNSRSTPFSTSAESCRKSARRLSRKLPE